MQDKLSRDSRSEAPVKGGDHTEMNQSRRLCLPDGAFFRSKEICGIRLFLNIYTDFIWCQITLNIDLGSFRVPQIK